MKEIEFIEKYNKIFTENYYVQVCSEEMRVTYNLEKKLRKWNANAPKKYYIKLNSSVNEAFEKLKAALSSEFQKDAEDIITLLEFKNHCQNNGIRERDINKKRDLIYAYIKERNLQSSIRVLHGDIIFDEKRVIIEKIDSIDAYRKKLDKMNLIGKGIYYRGQQNLNWTIKPSIFRGEWINYEKEFIHEMVINNSDDFANTHSTLDILTKMQHYNAPTRLLDLTTNPYIALYFACEKYDEDSLGQYGVIVFMESTKDTPEKYYDSDSVSIVSNLANMESDFKIPDETLSEDEFNRNEGVPYLLHQVRNEKPSFKGLIKHEDLHRCYIVHVKLDNKRILNQQGLFLLVGMGREKKEPADIKNSFRKVEGKQILFIIKDKDKKKILEELDLLNINKRFVYPEIDDVADYLKNEVYKN